MSCILNLPSRDIGLFRFLFSFYGLKIATLTIALSATPLPARSGTIVCETSRVFYNSKPSLKTECTEISSAESRLDSGIYARSLSYDQSIQIIPKLANIFGLSIKYNESTFDSYPAFADQKISEEGAILESYYNQMFNSQFLLDPIRTHPVESPFN